MNNYEEYKNLRKLLKTLTVHNIILAHVMSKPLGLEQQIIHDIHCIINSYNVADALIDKFYAFELSRKDMSQKNTERFKNIDVNFEELGIHFFKNGYVLDIRYYTSVCYKNPSHLDRPLRRIQKLTDKQYQELSERRSVGNYAHLAKTKS